MICYYVFMSAKRPLWKRIIYVILIILIVAVLLFAGELLYIHLRSRSFFSVAEKAFQYPDLENGFIPQGIEYDSSTDCFFLCGYMQDKSQPSPIYVINRSDGSLVASATMLKEDGTVFSGHSGGIALWKDLVFVAGTYDGVYVFARNDVLSSKNGERIKALGLFPLTVGSEKITSSFLEVHDDILTVGEFRMQVIAPTSKSHHISTPSGKQYAIALNYRLDSSFKLGISPEPFSAYSIPSLAQGICFTDDEILVSTSIMLLMSKVHVYESSALEVCGSFAGIPVYALDKSVRNEVLTTPPMLEEIQIVDGWLYCMSEFASEKYQIGKLFNTQWCWKTKIGEK